MAVSIQSTLTLVAILANKNNANLRILSNILNTPAMNSSLSNKIQVSPASAINNAIYTIATWCLRHPRQYD